MLGRTPCPWRWRDRFGNAEGQDRTSSNSIEVAELVVLEWLEAHGVEPPECPLPTAPEMKGG